jgi:hypothetical protein
MTARPPRLALASLLPLVLPLLLLAADSPARGQAVVVESIGVGLAGAYRLGSWTPVRVALKAGPAAVQGTVVEGTVELETADADGTPTFVRVPLALPAMGAQRVTLYTRPGARGGEFVVRVRDDRGRRLTPDARPDTATTPLRELEPGATLVAVLGEVAGVAEVVELGAFRGRRAGAGRAGLTVVPLAGGADALPDRWYGLDAATAVVADLTGAPARAALAARGAVLRRWLEEGGHLVLAGASGWDDAARLLGPLLPVTADGTARLNDPGEVETFAGSVSNPLLPVGAGMDVAGLALVPGRPAQTLAASTTTPLLVRAPAVFGRLTLVGLDVHRPPFSTWKDRSLFWVRALDLHGGEADGAGAGGAFFQAGATDLATLLYKRLDRPAGVTAVPFGWVAFLIFLYILLIGPGDYLFLRRVLKRRMEWTWITFPLIVVAVSAAAYAAAYALKGRELKVTQVDAIDVDAAAGRLRGTSWISLFSPQNRDYDLGLAPRPPGEPASSPAPAPAPAAGAETDLLLSWFGPAEPQLGGGRVSGLDVRGRGYRYAPDDRPERLAGVRVPIWSTKSLLGRWSGPAPAELIESDLLAIGSDRLEGTLTNRLDAPLRRAVLIFGDQVYDQLGTIAPGATVRVDLGSRSRPLSGYLEERARTLNAYAAGGEVALADRIDPADLVRVAMFREGMSPKTNTPPSHPLAHLDLSGQLVLERPMLVADLPGPAAGLVLDEGAPTPRVRAGAVLRVLLPLRPEPTTTASAATAPR